MGPRSWGSLRSRLIAAFAAIIFLTLVIVGVGFAFVFGQYQAQRELTRLGALAGQVSYQVRAHEAQGASAAEIGDLLARQSDDLDVRIILATPQGRIFHDTQGDLFGQRIDIGASQRIGAFPRARLVNADGGRRIVFVAGPGGPPGSPVAERFLGRQSAYLVALVSEPLTIAAILREMAPRLLPAALISLLASIGVAWLFAASIARPLARMTRAAEEIARGRYGHAIPEQGADEVGRLATAFNAMAREVAGSQRTLRDFVANVSHDLRTPLTSIQGFSQAMVDGSLRDRDDYAQAGQIINEEAERMSRLVEDLLELSKIESGQAALNLADVDLAALLRGVVGRAERATAERGIDLVYRFDAAPVVRADPRRLERVFDNLLGNAIKHTPRGGRIVLAVGSTAAEAHEPDAHGGRARGVARWPGRVGRLPERAAGQPRILEPGRGPSSGVVAASSGGQPLAVVSVHNTGSAIPPEDLPRIFERFYQVDKSRTGSAEGSGLGLAIAREIVQAHGGQIFATSSPTDGTELAVTIPLLDPAPVAGLGSARDGRREPAVGRLRAS
jgi:signal transduction histidine kinase